ncbi:hypothetical protein B0H14DRAFT_3893999 [Mycena olivaceomarginata]|nr:hypothetical protein B0H14DRAFT_3893999 [Mycena olivaceomarginata]
MRLPPPARPSLPPLPRRHRSLPRLAPLIPPARAQGQADCRSPRPSSRHCTCAPHPHTPAAVAPTLRMLPCARRAWRTCARLAGSIFDPLGSSGCPLCAPHAPTATVLTQRSLPRPRRALRTCARIVGSISAPQSIFGTLLRRRAHAALAPAAVALTHRMLPRPRRTSLGPFLCPSRFSGPPSLRIVYPHVSRHMWHAPVRRPPLLRSQPPLARPLRVPTVAPIQRTLARPDPWN